MITRVFALYLCLFMQIITGNSNPENTAAKVPSQSDPGAIVLPELKLDGIPLRIFTDALLASGASGGIASLDSACSYGRKESLFIQAGTTLGKALDEIASATGSKWQINEGAVNMFPASGVPPLLETRIQRFEWEKTASAKETVGRIVTMPEVVQEARKLGLTAGSTGGGATAICIVGDCSAKPKPAPLIQFEKDVTLLSILNRVATAHDRVAWSYLEYRCENETRYTLYISAE